jgi:hypothetical protein
MLRLYAEPYLIICRCLGRWEQLSHHFRNSSEMNDLVDGSDREENRKWIAEIRKPCEEAGLVSSLDQLLRMEISMNSPTVTNRAWGQMQMELANRFNDEFSRKLIFWIPPGKEKFYEQKGALFGPAVTDAFESTRTDIEEAGKCYAAGRNTACVFHLMRVMEHGLRALGKTLNEPNLDPSRNPSWETILRRGDEELKLPIRKRSGDWRIKDEFFTNATANLRAVKDAWRNPTMHVERDYDEEKALDILNAVGAFMRHLSTELTDKSE